MTFENAKVCLILERSLHIKNKSAASMGHHIFKHFDYRQSCVCGAELRRRHEGENVGL